MPNAESRASLARTWAAILESEHPGTRWSVDFDAADDGALSTNGERRGLQPEETKGGDG